MLEQAASEFLGGSIKVEFRGADGATPPLAPREPTRVPDKDDLVEQDEGAIDPTDLVVDILGGEIVQE